jgi:putative aldouronate transport system permease protein
MAAHASSFKQQNASDKLFNVITVVLCALIFIIVIYPIYFIIIASFSNSTMVNQGQVIFFPKGFSFYGYQQIFKEDRIWTGYKNTIIYSVLGTGVNLLFTLPAAYALSRREFKARRVIMALFTFTMFFSGGLIPTFVLIKNLHMIDTIWAMIIPFSVNVFNLIICRTFFESSIPESLYEAAILDGCSHFKYFLRIVIPLSKAVVSVIFLYYLVGHWNDFFNGLIYINKDNLKPLQIILRNILLSNQVFTSGSAGTGGAGGYAQQYADQVKYGVIIVSTLPMLIVYPFIQKYFEKGVMIGAVKG